MVTRSAAAPFGNPRRFSPGLILLAALSIGCNSRHGETPVHAALPDSIRGVYLNSHVTSSPETFASFLQSLAGTTLNAIVIDAKDDAGVLYRSDLRLPRSVTRHKKLMALDTIIALAHRRELHVIARIVTFKDPALARREPAWALLTPTATAWKDRAGTSWVDPWNKDVWKYNLDIAEEVARAGADAIQFDYVRFPEPFRNLPLQVSPASRGERAEAIPQFLSAARQRLNGLHVQVSADVFGYVMHVPNDLGIGQHWESLLSATDQVSPMIYPSHYSAPAHGPHPNSCPYAATRSTLSLGIGRSKRATTSGKRSARIVPWLQAFQTPALDRGYRYGPRTVAAQIEAVHDAGLRDWILWNARSEYEPFRAAFVRGGAMLGGVDVAGCSAAFRWGPSETAAARVAVHRRSASPFDEPAP